MLAILKNYIKKKIPNNSKLYILLLFFKHFKFHLLKTLIQMIYFDFVKKNISIKVNENEILLTCQEFNTISYFIDNKINEKIILTFIYNYFKESNKVFLDIGGFIGLHSLICANSSDKSKIYSFEANQKIYNIFLKNIKINNLKNIVLDSRFITSDDDIRNKNDFTNYNKNTITINSYLKEQNISKVDLLKIDIEGLEVGVLKNLDFSRFKIILIEFHINIIKHQIKKDPKELIKILKKNYKIHYLNHRLDNPDINEFDEEYIENLDECMLICHNEDIDNLKIFFNKNITFSLKKFI